MLELKETTKILDRFYARYDDPQGWARNVMNANFSKVLLFVPQNVVSLLFLSLILGKMISSYISSHIDL